MPTQNRPFLIGGQMFVHADHILKLTPGAGPNAGQPWQSKFAKSLEAKNEGKAIVAKGGTIVPVAIAMGESEGSFTIGFDVMQGSIDYLDWCGDGAQRMTHQGQIIFIRPSVAPVTFYLVDMILEKAFGLKSDAGAQPSDEFSGKMRLLEMKVKGRRINPFRVPAGTAIET
jgi:hypothetical protein